MADVLKMIDDSLLVWRPTGCLDMVKIASQILFLEERERSLGRTFDRFADLTALTDIALNHDDLLQVCARRENLLPDAGQVKAAFLADNPLAFGMARMYQQMLRPASIEMLVDDDLDKLAGWLGRPLHEVFEA